MPRSDAHSGTGPSHGTTSTGSARSSSPGSATLIISHWHSRASPWPDDRTERQSPEQAINVTRFGRTILIILPSIASAVGASAQEERPHVYRRVVVLCVGIETYGHQSLPPAPGAEGDATKVGQTLASDYG